jgi:hypothetical protein
VRTTDAKESHTKTAIVALAAMALFALCNFLAPLLT